MIPLKVMYQERCHELRARLEHATTPAHICQAMQDALSTLETEYTKGLSLPQLRVALPLFEALRQVLDAFRAVRFIQSAPAPPERSSTVKVFGYLDDLLEAWLLRSAKPQAKNEALVERVRVESGAYLDHLGNALAAIDQAVTEAMPAPQPAPGPAELTQEAYGQLLQFLQDLAADAQDDAARTVLARIRQLPRILETYGIQVEVYHPDGQPSGLDPRRLFEFEPSGDQCITLVPAFVKGDRVLLRGHVVVPIRHEEGAA